MHGERAAIRVPCALGSQSVSRAQEAAERIGGSVLVEDTSLCFAALNGLPGPYIKWFVQVHCALSRLDCLRDLMVSDDPPVGAQTLGNDGLYDLLASHSDKSAYCQCILGFSSGPGAEPLLFTGRTHGKIVEPVGSGGFGWDAIFIPEGHDGPFGTMTLEAKNQISHRARALSAFVEYVNDHVYTRSRPLPVCIEPRCMHSPRASTRGRRPKRSSMRFQKAVQISPNQMRICRHSSS